MLNILSMLAQIIAVTFMFAMAGCGGGTSGSGGTNVVDLQGQVLSSSLAGVSNATVTLGDASGIDIATTRTNTAGNFSFLSVPQRSGEIKVTLPANGGQTRVLYDAPTQAREVRITVQQQANGGFRNSVTFRRRGGEEIDDNDEDDDDDEGNRDDDEDDSDDSDDDSDNDDGEGPDDDDEDSDDGDEGEIPDDDEDDDQDDDSEDRDPDDDGDDD